MNNIYRKLKKEQKERGVIFSSTLSNETIEQQGDYIIEILEEDEDKKTKIDRLKNAKHFDDFKRYNIIRN